MLDRPGKDRSWRKPEPQNSPLGSVPARPEGHDLAGSPVSLTQHRLGMARGFPSNREKVISIPDLEGCLSQLTLKIATPYHRPTALTSLTSGPHAPLIGKHLGEVSCSPGCN